MEEGIIWLYEDPYLYSTHSTISLSLSSQVSQLVILHEDAQQGRIMPDISLPVTVVCAAVQNLIAVSHTHLCSFPW